MMASLLASVLLYAAGHQSGLFNGAGPPPATARGHVIVGSRLMAAGEKGRRSAQSFDRLRIPSDTTEMQLSFIVETPPRGARFETALEAVDGGAVIHAFPTVVEPLHAGGIARVTVPAPPDGDYVLRLHRIVGERVEIVVTKTFRLTRDRKAASGE